MSETNKDKGAKELPPTTRNLLTSSYSDYRSFVGSTNKEAQDKARTDFALVASVGREKGWTLTDIAAPCGISGERVRQFVKGFDITEADKERADEIRKIFPQRSPSAAGESRTTRRRKKPSLTEEERAELQELASIACKTTGSSPLGSPERVASQKLSELIDKYRTRDKSVRWKDLADATGLSESGIRARAYRHGYHDGPPPTVKPYSNTVTHDKKRLKRLNKNKEVA